MAFSFLIADDEEIDLMALTKLVTENIDDAGCVFRASNGLEAVRILIENRIDIAIIDIEMPVMNGIEAIKEIRKKNIRTKVIVNTAYSDFEYAVEALKLDADDYIVKPMVRSRILGAIQKCISKIETERKQENTRKALIDALESAAIRGEIEKEKAGELLDTEDISKYIVSAKKYVLANYERDFSIEMMSDSMGISASYLSRIFKRESGTNLNDYITDVRMEKARELMKKSDYSVRELAEKCGYNNFTYFCKIFKKRTGMTVGEYKNSQRKPQTITPTEPGPAETVQF